MELVQVGEKTYCIQNSTNIGIYLIDDQNVFLIDTGNDKDAGKKILKILDEKGWNVKGIISTHSNADHIGGNNIIQKRTGCKIFSHKIEKSFIEFPILESSFLWGGYPFQELRNKFLFAKESVVDEVVENLPIGLEFFPLKGHFFDMIGVKTSDHVYFLADSLFCEETIAKYSKFYIYDVREFLNTLDFLETLEGTFYIPSHCNILKDIHPIIDFNREKVLSIIEEIYQICKEGKTFEEILKVIFDQYQLEMNSNQYVLIGSTLKSYLSYLCDEGRITYDFQDHRMIWRWMR